MSISDSILEFRKSVRTGQIQMSMMGKALHLTDTETGMDYRIGEMSARKPESKPLIEAQGEVPVCPVCDRSVVDSIGTRYAFCPKCGVKIDWENKEVGKSITHGLKTDGLVTTQ